MVLAVDVGNTKTAVALVEGSTIRARAQWPTDQTGAAVFEGALGRAPGAERIVVATVVPRARRAWDDVATWLSLPITVLSRGDQVPVTCDVDEPSKVGVDRLVNLLGAALDDAPPLVVVDLGTATTIDALDRSGHFVGGAILPGAGTAMRALAASTAQLPEVRLVAPPSPIGRNTAHAIQSGVVLGYAGGIDSLVAAISRELGGATCVATGGLAAVFAPHCRCFHRVDDTITLRGIARAWELAR